MSLRTLHSGRRPFGFHPGVVTSPTLTQKPLTSTRTSASTAELTTSPYASAAPCPGRVSFPSRQSWSVRGVGARRMDVVGARSETRRDVERVAERGAVRRAVGRGETSAPVRDERCWSGTGGGVEGGEKMTEGTLRVECRQREVEGLRQHGRPPTPNLRARARRCGHEGGMRGIRANGSPRAGSRCVGRAG